MGRESGASKVAKLLETTDIDIGSSDPAYLQQQILRIARCFLFVSAQGIETAHAARQAADAALRALTQLVSDLSITSNTSMASMEKVASTSSVTAVERIAGPGICEGNPQVQLFRMTVDGEQCFMVEDAVAILGDVTTDMWKAILPKVRH